MVSIVVPAYNEGKTIEYCLGAMLKDADPDEFDIVVVCNACRDDTAQRARAFESQGVTVLETDTPGKTNALNLGDDAARSFPRFYVDADIQLEASAIRDIVQMMAADPSIVVAAPRAIFDYERRDRLVRSFYRVWTNLPYYKAGVSGGVYVFSEAGRKRFGRFPDILGDDLFARLQAKPHERRCSDNSSYKVVPPTNIRELINITTRAHAGNKELRERYPQLLSNEGSSPQGALRTIATTPRLWRHAPVYLGVTLLSRLRARLKMRNSERAKQWERDESSRATFGNES